MPSRDDLIRELTNQWLDKAGDDLNAAQALFDHGGDLWPIVAFHCQQSAEKNLKAMLTSLQVEFSKTHDIAILLDSLEGIDGEIGQTLRPAEALTVYGVQVRYPGDDPEVGREEAAQALNLAKDVANRILAILGR
ncbi:HEPN domain-containing protein [bacterium]|nr:HEPN domain-containing protein [bacterium]